MSRLTLDELMAGTDDQILEAYDSARSDVSYFNAAESPQWGLETSARNMAKNYMALVKGELDRRGLTPNKGNYLC